MKYIKLFEDYQNYEWNNIYQEGNSLFVHVYQLSNEMLKTLGDDPDERDEQAVFDLEKEYCELVKELLEGQVITFSCSDCSQEHDGICESVEFEGEFQAPERGFFHVEHIRLKLEDFDEPHGLDDDKIIVHLDDDVDLYRNVKKYNV